MQKTVLRWLGVILLAAAALPAPVRAADDVVMKAMHDELDRSMKTVAARAIGEAILHLLPRAGPHLAGYLGDFRRTLAGGVSRVRFLTVQVRVGDYQRDNSNFMTDPPQANGLRKILSFPSTTIIRKYAGKFGWPPICAYKSALEMLSRKRGAMENRQARENLPDFSKEQPVTSLEPFSPIKMDLPAAEVLVKNLSAALPPSSGNLHFHHKPECHRHSDWYLNSEGSAVTGEDSDATLVAMAQTQAMDGTMLPDWVMVSGRSVEGLPTESELASQIRSMAARLTKVRHSPLIDRYNGPVLFEGPAGAEAFSQVHGAKINRDAHPCLRRSPNGSLRSSEREQISGAAGVAHTPPIHEHY